MKIADYFDVTNSFHLKAYRTLQDTGAWPKGFIPEGTEFTPGWHGTLGLMLANAYIDEKLGELA